MDSKRVAIAGNNFRTSAFSDEYDLNNPEYATPLGIAVSSGLNLINASFRVILNGRPANLFRSGSFTALNLLMMNGYSFLDIMGHSGANLVVTVNGRRKVFYGTPVEPAALFINKKEGRLSEIIQAGDEIDFTPAVSGVSAAACLGDINGAAEAVELTLNGMPADLETQLKMGDVIVMRRPGEEALPEEAAEAEEEAAAEDVPAAEEGAEPEPAAVPEQEQEPVQQEESAAAPDRTAETAAEFSEPAGTERQPETAEETAEETEPVEMKQEEEPKPALNPQRNFAQRSALEAAAPVSQREEKTAVSAQPPEVHFHLNGMPITLPRKTDGTSYFLMDMIQYSGIDLKQPKGRIVLTVNGMQGLFQQELRDGDNIRIEEEM